jgi:beta-phosphoglucomutase-like phosphatase (HAD superfamily)
VTKDDEHRQLVESLRSEWRAALVAARGAVEANEHYLRPAELRAEERHLQAEYATAAAELRRLALDEGLPPELAQPFLPRGRARRALGLPETVRACVLELDDLLVATRALQVDAWTRTFDELLSSRIGETYGRSTPPFTPQVDYPAYVHARPRVDGVRAFLASRGIRLPEGLPGDAPGTETVHGVANRKNELLGALLEQRGAPAIDGARHFLELAHDAGMNCAAVSASTHTAELLERAGLDELVDATVDADTISAENLSVRLSPDRLLAACRKLGIPPEQAAAFETDEPSVLAARTAGFAVVVAVTPDADAAQARRLRRYGADVVVPALAGLLDRAA